MCKMKKQREEGMGQRCFWPEGGTRRPENGKRKNAAAVRNPGGVKCQ
jgi:hypothetical protein